MIARDYLQRKKNILDGLQKLRERLEMCLEPERLPMRTAVVEGILANQKTLLDDLSVLEAEVWNAQRA